MTQEAMKERLYELYHLKWMMTHGYSLERLMSKLDNGGEKWNSFKEFCRAEMSDIGYIKSLLDIVPSEEGLRDAYNKWLDDNNMEATVA